MLAESLHATADTGNELLLPVGMKRSSRPPDEFDPYGHGKALNFYSLLVSQNRNQGLCASISSCHRFAAEISLGLSGLVSGAAKMRPSRSISANGLLGLH